jgi:hypothetical protein
MEEKTIEQLDREIRSKMDQVIDENYVFPEHPVDKIELVVGVDMASGPDKTIVTKGRAVGYSVDPDFLAGIEELKSYDPDNLDHEAFKKRYAGFYQKDNGKRLSKSSMRGIWRRFMTHERHAFLTAHTNLTLYDIGRVGIDKFIITMGWRSKADTKRWRNNKVRIGICCHCQDQFIPMMFQHNHGLCNNCKPLFSSKAMRNFVLDKLHNADRYQHAHRDMLMDFYIMFYSDEQLRKLFLKTDEFAQEWAAKEFEAPEWLPKEAGWEQGGPIDIEGGVIEDAEV